MATLTAMDTQPAFRNGYEAYRKGSLAMAVPYHESTDNYRWWLQGWRAAQEDEERLVDELETRAAGAAPDVNWRVN